MCSSDLGVPISAILFGGRRASVVPLVNEAFDWEHGVFLGSTMASETTAAAAGASGVLRRDPFAMLPFCGYNMADYFAHWLSFGPRLKNPPKIFRVNWFRRDENNKFLWPGYGENMRVLKWMIDRIEGSVQGQDNVFGVSPQYRELNWSGLDFNEQQFQQVTSLDKSAWQDELKLHAELFEQLHHHLPTALSDAKAALEKRLAA